MHGDDFADLVAYLRRLGDPAQPGLSETEVVVAAAPGAQVEAVTRAVIEGYFADVNASGGIFGRKLRLDSATTVDPERAFAVLCTSAADVDPQERVPLVTPFPSGAGDAELPAAFFLYPDLRTQALALAQSVTPGARVYVVSDGSAAAGDAASAVTNAVAAVALGPELKLAAPVQPRDTDFLFLIGRVDTPALLRRLEERQWRPRILVAGGNVGEFRDAKGEVLFAVPTLPGDITAEAHEELEAFAMRHQLPRTQQATQIATYAAVKVFVEGLQRAGRELTREKLIAALEQLYDFPTGFTPPLTFGRNRHIGSAGAYVVSPDLRYRSFVRVGGGER
jgi:ABC-type branched-subunit amino acid transport system substrate-binding protein